MSTDYAKNSKKSMKVLFDLIQQTPAWFYEKKGKVSGTDLKSIIGTPKARQKLFYKKVAERLMTGTNERDEDPRDRGNRLEDEGVAMFELRTGKVVIKAGLCQHPTNEFVVYSPDGLIKSEDGKFREDVEVKSFEGAMFVETWFTNKVPDEYYAQVIQAFIVNDDLETRYFIAYCPEIEIYPLHIIPIRRSDVIGDINAYRMQELIFLKEVDDKVAEIIKL